MARSSKKISAGISGAKEAAAMAPLHRVAHQKDPGNPNRQRSVYLLNVLMISFVALLAVGAALVLLIRNSRATAELEKLTDQITGEDEDVDKIYFTRAELNAAVDRVRGEAVQSEHTAMLTQIRSSLESGTPAESTVRTLFPGETVVYRDGTYRFYPLEAGRDRHPFVWDDFVCEEDGTLTYKGSNEALEFANGIDLGEAQGTPDWDAVAGQNDFVMIRVGGRDEKGRFAGDEMADKNLAAAAGTQLAIGAFYDLQSADGDAAMDAELILGILEPHRDEIGLPVAVRVIEPVRPAEGYDTALWTEHVLEICGALEAAGYETMVGGDAEAMLGVLDPARVPQDSIWLLETGEHLYYPYSLRMWQYDDEWTAEGVDAYCGRDKLVTDKNR